MSPLEAILVDVLASYNDWRGNEECNDWSIDDTPENRAFVNHVYLYGIAKRLWDGECGPSFRNGKICWFDTAATAYIKKALLLEDLKIDMKVSI